MGTRPLDDHAHHDHSDAHGHGHSHGLGHGHVDASTTQTRLIWAFAITAGFMVVEVVGGWLAGSLALMADAAHMLTDAAALGLAWYAVRASQRPADDQRSYGYHRVQILAAFVNGVALLALVAWIGFEAVLRLAEPAPVLAGPMLIVAAIGLGVNAAVFAILHGAGRQNLNVRGAMLHVLGDLLGSAAAIAAAIVIMTTGWTPIDPLLSLLIVLLIVRSAWSLVRQSGHILLEGSPQDMDLEAVRHAIQERVDDVVDVHHLHAWSLTPEHPILTLHARLRPEGEDKAVLAAIKGVLADEFKIRHATVQLEHGPCPDGPDCAVAQTAGT